MKEEKDAPLVYAVVYMTQHMDLRIEAVYRDEKEAKKQADDLNKNDNLYATVSCVLLIE